MHLTELLAHRAIPASGVSIGITRRCPLKCDHCSTSSTMQSEQLPAQVLRRFVETFLPDSHPKFMAMSGGEALLRPHLVCTLATAARKAGTRSSLLSGLFFVRHSAHIPPAIRLAIDAVDHFSVSMDVFHEREVPRAHVFDVLSQLLDEGKYLSIHIAGRDGADTYLDDLVCQVKCRFGRNIPMLVNTLSAFGRAKTILLPRTLGSTLNTDTAPDPCTMAAWPVVGFDGIVAACGNDNLIGCVPQHLRLGDIHSDTWETIRERCENRAMLMALRTYGPRYLTARFINSEMKTGTACSSYCETCIHLNENKDLQEDIQRHFEKPGVRALSSSVTSLQVENGAVAYAKRYSHPRYAELVMLGA